MKALIIIVISLFSFSAFAGKGGSGSGGGGGISRVKVYQNDKLQFIVVCPGQIDEWILDVSTNAEDDFVVMKAEQLCLQINPNS